MSVHYTALAMIGVRIRIVDVMVRLSHEGCEHETPPNANFCPECGKPVKSARIPTKPVLAAVSKYLTDASRDFHGYKVYVVPGSDTIYFGIGVQTGIDHERAYRNISVIEISEVQKAIEDVLSRAKIDNVDLNQRAVTVSFGLHAYLDVQE